MLPVLLVLLECIIDAEAVKVLERGNPPGEYNIAED